VQFVSNGQTYDKGYYLDDGIYPKWDTFVKPLGSPSGRKNKTFTVLKRLLGRMLRKNFGFCKPNFLLFEVQRTSGIKRSFGTSWWLVWSCITWSLRTSMFKMWTCITTSWVSSVVQWQRDRTTRLIECYHAIRDEDTHEVFRRISWRSGGHGGDNNGVVDVIELCDELCVFVTNYACLWVNLCASWWRTIRVIMMNYLCYVIFSIAWILFVFSKYFIWDSPYVCKSEIYIT
jgi:hypothetical protein